MVAARTVLLCGLLIAGACARRANDAPPPTTQASVQAAALAAPPHAPSGPAPEPEAAPSAGCATSESCSAAAETEQRAGHPDRAAPLYERACELGLGQACHRLGELYRDGKGVTTDDGRAHELFELGCREGSNAACDELGH